VVDHAVGTPLAHSSKDYITKAWKTFDTFTELNRSNVSILQGTVIQADPATKQITYTTEQSEAVGLKHLNYDYLVVATGLRRPWPTVPTAKTKHQYIKDATEFVSKLDKSTQKVVVVGGGW